MNGLKTVLVACVLLVAICLPVSACTSVTDTDTCGLDNEDCEDNCGAKDCGGNNSDCTCSEDEEIPSGVITGSIACDSGTCEKKLCINGTCYENAADNTSAEDVKAAIECENNSCQTVICNTSGCTTDSFTITDNDESFVEKWMKNFFGEKKEVEVKPVANTSDVNYYGNIANANIEEVAPVKEEIAAPEKVVTPIKKPCVTGCKPIKPVCTSPRINMSACSIPKINTTACISKVNYVKPVTVKPAAAVKPVVTPVKTLPGSANCDSYSAAYQALRADKTEKKIVSSTYQSLQCAQDVKKAMNAKKIDCIIVKVTFTDGKVSYLNSIKTCDGTLLVDSCGTPTGTGIKKVVNTLEVGKQWSATSLFKECPKTYTRGIVKSIE